MRGWKLSAAAVAFSMSASLAATYAADRDPYEGEWSGQCKGAQCWLEIGHKGGKNYLVSFIVADRMDAGKVLCRADIPMERDRLEFTPTMTYEDGLSGPYKTDNLAYIIPGFDYGSLDFFTEERCGKFQIPSEYEPIGD